MKYRIQIYFWTLFNDHFFYSWPIIKSGKLWFLTHFLLRIVFIIPTYLCFHKKFSLVCKKYIFTGIIGHFRRNERISQNNKPTPPGPVIFFMFPSSGQYWSCKDTFGFCFVLFLKMGKVFQSQARLIVRDEFG